MEPGKETAGLRCVSDPNAQAIPATGHLPGSQIHTSDLDYAAAMLSKGADLGTPEWTHEWIDGRRQLSVHLVGVPPKAASDYRTGQDGLSSFMLMRKMLMDAAKGGRNRGEHHARGNDRRRYGRV